VSYVVGVVIAIMIVALLLICLITLVCWKHYRSRKQDAIIMVREQRFPQGRRVSRHSAVNPSFPAFDTSPSEFPRDKLVFISVIGEGKILLVLLSQ
jgi:hypothetical protein